MERGSERVHDLGPASVPVTGRCVQRRASQADLGTREIARPHVGNRSGDAGGFASRGINAAQEPRRSGGVYHGCWGWCANREWEIHRPARETYTLKDRDEAALRVLRNRRESPASSQFAAGSPILQGDQGDSALIDSGRLLNTTVPAYPEWCASCARSAPKEHVLLFDEVFVGFRLAAGGCPGILVVRADYVTYGKTLAPEDFPWARSVAGGELMNRFRDDRAAGHMLRRGTFKPHPYVMGAMYEFLAVETRERQANVRRSRRALEARDTALNERLKAAGIPVQVTTTPTPTLLDLDRQATCGHRRYN